MSQQPRRVMTGVPEAAQSPVEDLVGLVVGEQYDVIQCVHSGSLSALYLARHGGDGRELTLRVFVRDVGSDEPSSRAFHKEARALAELRHPNLLSVVDYGKTDGGSHYIVTEAPQTRTLREVLAREHKLPPERVVTMLMQLARALAMARGAGLMHGNLKAENILILVQSPGKNDVVKLQDLGVAKLMRTRPGPQQAMVLATPRTMAPEQSMGVVDDPRSDIYALGCIVFEMLSGKPPYDGPGDDALLAMHREAPVPALSDVTASSMLQELVARMLAKKPEARPSHARLLEEVELLPEYIEPDDLPSLGPAGGDGPTLGMPMGNRDMGGPSLGLSGVPAATTDEFAPPPRAKKSAGIPSWAIGAGAAGIAVVIGIAAFSGGNKEPPPAPVTTETAPAPPEAEVDVDVSGMKLTGHKKAAQPAPQHRPAATNAAPVTTESRLIQITVTSEPKGAHVFEGPIERGTTPATLLIPKDSGPRTIRLSLEGHDDVIRAVNPETTTSVNVVMKKSEGAAPAAEKKEEEKKEAPAPAPAVVEKKEEKREDEKKEAPAPAPAAVEKKEEKKETPAPAPAVVEKKEDKKEAPAPAPAAVEKKEEEKKEAPPAESP